MVPPPGPLDKAALVAAWRAELEDRAAALRSSQAAAGAGTRVDGTHRPANRGERAAVTAQGYLAHGLGQRLRRILEERAGSQFFLIPLQR